MNNFLVSTEFKLFVFPLITVFLNIFVKINTFDRRYSKVSKESFAVGLEVTLTTIIALIIYAATIAEQLSLQTVSSSPTVILDKQLNAIFMSFLFFGGLFGVTGLVRERGWKAKNTLNTLGVVAPFIYALITLFATAKVMGA